MIVFRKLRYIGVRTPRIAELLTPSAFWFRPSIAEKSIFLTFDDGPTPVVTPFVLDLLAKFNAKATFFCVGQQVEKYPQIYQRILDQGHSVGNHTYSHVNGFQVNTNSYLENIALAAKFINSKLFRPPYGRLKPSQYRAIKPNYRVVFWHLLAADYMQQIDIDVCVARATNGAKSGDIVVLHDSQKAFGVLEKALPIILNHYHERGFNMIGIPM